MLLSLTSELEHLLNKYLMSASLVPGSVLGAGEAVERPQAWLPALAKPRVGLPGQDGTQVPEQMMLEF